MRLIDADALIAKNNLAPRIAARGNAKPMISAVLSSVYFMVMGAPTIDAVEVVRCKDCIYFDNPFENGQWFCQRGRARHMKSNDFCSYGERKGGEG